jgi:hypothetical protein
VLSKKLPPWFLLAVLGPVALMTSAVIWAYDFFQPDKLWAALVCSVLVAVLGVGMYVYDWFFHRCRQASSRAKEKPAP